MVVVLDSTDNGVGALWETIRKDRGVIDGQEWVFDERLNLFPVDWDDESR